MAGAPEGRLLDTEAAGDAAVVADEWGDMWEWGDDGAVVSSSCDLENPEVCESCQ